MAATPPINMPCSTGVGVGRASHQATGTKTMNDPATATVVRTVSPGAGREDWDDSDDEQELGKDSTEDDAAKPKR